MSCFSRHKKDCFSGLLRCAWLPLVLTLHFSALPRALCVERAAAPSAGGGALWSPPIRTKTNALLRISWTRILPASRFLRPFPFVMDVFSRLSCGWFLCFIPLLWYWFALVAFVCYDWSQAKDLLISTAAPLTASLRTIATIPSTTSLGFFFLFVHLFVQVWHACEIKYLNKLYTFYRSFHWLFEFDQAGQRFDSQLK